jgi:hypothetical protein
VKSWSNIASGRLKPVEYKDKGGKYFFREEDIKEMARFRNRMQLRLMKQQK